MENNSSAKITGELTKVTFTIVIIVTVINYGFVRIYATEDIILVWGLSFFILFLHSLAKQDN